MEKQLWSGAGVTDESSNKEDVDEKKKQEPWSPAAVVSEEAARVRWRAFLFLRLHKSFKLVGGDTRRMIFGDLHCAVLYFILFFPHRSRQHSAEQWSLKYKGVGVWQAGNDSM